MSENKNILNLVSEEIFVEKMTALTDAVTEKNQLKPRVDALEQVINGDDSTPGIIETLDGKQPAGDYATRAELEAEVTRAQEAEELNAQQLLTLVGNVEGDTAKSAREIAKEEAQAEVRTLIGAAPEALDSLEEVAEWIQNDESGTQVILNDISTLKDKVDTGDKTVSEYVAEAAQIHWGYF